MIILLTLHFSNNSISLYLYFSGFSSFEHPVLLTVTVLVYIQFIEFQCIPASHVFRVFSLCFCVLLLPVFIVVVWCL